MIDLFFSCCQILLWKETHVLRKVPLHNLRQTLTFHKQLLWYIYQTTYIADMNMQYIRTILGDNKRDATINLKDV